MRLVADISAWQTHDANDWTIRRPYDLGVFAGAVGAAWIRWTDWHGFVQWGADPDYALCIDTLRDLGKPVGPYLYPRPNMTDPVTQIRAWRVATPAITWAPMLDLETSGGLSGGDLSRWVDVALAEMTQQFGRVPWLYTQASKVAEWGLSRPSTPHLLILAGGHWYDQPFPWAQRAGWEGRALTVGPDLPTGWDHWDAWQFTSHAEIPGMPGVIDCSLVTDAAYADSANGPLGAASVDDGFTDDDRELLTLVHRVFT